MLLERARELATQLSEVPGYETYKHFKASHAWLSNVFSRNKLSGVNASGEAGSIDEEQAQKLMHKFILDLVATGVRDPARIFNMDETGLFYAQVPNYCVVLEEEILSARGQKQMYDKSRVTVILCCSAMGAKAKPCVVGSSKNPHCFRKYGLPKNVAYMQQKNAWLDGDVCCRWFGQVFLPFKRERVGMHKAVLLWDNFSGHMPASGVPDVIILPLPPNLTGRHQPLDQGIISSFKIKYKYQLLSAIDKALPRWHELRALGKTMKPGTVGLEFAHNPHMSNVCELVDEAWSNVTLDTIINCWVKARCLPEDMQKELRSNTLKGKQQISLLQEAEDASVFGKDLDEVISKFNEVLTRVDFETLRDDNRQLAEILLPFEEQCARDLVVSEHDEAALTRNLLLEDDPHVVEAITCSVIDEMQKFSLHELLPAPIPPPSEDTTILIETSEKEAPMSVEVALFYLNHVTQFLASNNDESLSHDCDSLRQRISERFVKNRLQTSMHKFFRPVDL